MHRRKILTGGRGRRVASLNVENLEARTLMSGGAAGVPLITVDSTGAAENPAVAMTASGGYVVAWTDTTGLDGSGDGIMARIYDSSGNPTGSAFVVNSNTTGNQVDPAVTVAPNGDIAFAWTDTNTQRVTARLFTGDGSPISPSDVQVATSNLANSDAEAAISTESGGTFDLGYVTSGGGTDLTEQALTSSLSPTGSPDQLGNVGSYRPIFDGPAGQLTFGDTGGVADLPSQNFYTGVSVSGAQINVSESDAQASETTNINSLSDGPNGFVAYTMNSGSDAVAAWVDSASGDVVMQPIPTSTVTVNSIVPITFRTQSANSVQWNVTFSQPVAELSASNLQLPVDGLTQSPTIQSVVADSPTNGFATTWTVTATTGSGAGVLGLNFVNSTGMFLTQTVTNTLAGQVYAFESTPTSTTTFSQVSIPSVAYGATQDTLNGSLLGSNVQPTGSVTATLGGTLVSGTINANGQFSIPMATAGLAPGVYLVDVDYSGDGVSSSASTTLTLDVGAVPASFSGLSAPSIVVGSGSTALGGSIGGGATGLTPGGAVMITLDGVTQLTAINPDGSFSSVFNTGGLAAGSYPVSFSYAGDAHFDSASGNATVTVEYAASGTTSAAKASAKRRQGAVFSVNVAGSSGKNLGSSKLTLSLVGYAAAGSPLEVTPAVASAKSAEPVFRRLGKSYVLEMKMPKTMARGSYLLYYKVGNDPTIRSIEFQV